jgi:hypothetical protein
MPQKYDTKLTGQNRTIIRQKYLEITITPKNLKIISKPPNPQSSASEKHCLH